MQWIRYASTAAVVLAAPLLTSPRASGQALDGPSPTSSDIAEGQRLFLKNCALCHGGDAMGGRGPNLTRGFFRNAATDDQLLGIVQGGIMGTDMPWTGLSDRSAAQVVAYIRSLGGGAVELPGDPVAGRELFFGGGTCSTCHMVDGQGARQGPDLSWVGWRRAPDYLRASILDPSADVEPRWWTVDAVTKSGRRISGVLVDEDQFNVRILDESDGLHAIAKSDIESLERIKTSKMPSFEGTLTDEQLDDLVSYLARLRGGEADS
jgi:putative heme-binding domain-containing protein